MRRSSGLCARFCARATPRWTSCRPPRAAKLAGLPGLGPARAGDGDDRTGPAQARLFEALLTLLHVLGEQAPVLLVVEDLHWADSSTRACLAFLSRSLAGERVLLVATYRPDELHRATRCARCSPSSSAARTLAASTSAR